jgi:hypothetical protein
MNPCIKQFREIMLNYWPQGDRNLKPRRMK